MNCERGWKFVKWKELERVGKKGNISDSCIFILTVNLSNHSEASRKCLPRNVLSFHTRFLGFQLYI